MSAIYEIVKLKQEIKICETLAPMNANSSYSIAKWLQEEIGFDTQENFVILCLDVKNYMTFFSIVHRGTVNSTSVHPRDIFQRAYLSNAVRIIIAHNHPSNNCTPSGNDQKFTKKVKECGDLLGIPLLDHIIVGRDTYLSFREENLL